MPSSIQNPAFSCRVRMKSESAVSATRMTGVAQRDSSAPSQRVGTSLLAKAGGTYQRYSCRGRGTDAGGVAELRAVCRPHGPARGGRALLGARGSRYLNGRRAEALDRPLAVAGVDD